MSSEGSREIDALKQRLAAAKAQSQSASTMMDSALAMEQAATKMIKTARANMASSAQEVKAAGALLKDAEKRWEVIDVDDNASADLLKNDRSKKRRKVSMSPDSTNADNGDTTGAFGDATSRQSNNSNGNSDAIGRVYNHFLSAASGTNGATATAHQSNNNGNIRSPAEQIIVEGCGLSEVNGTYACCDRLVLGLSTHTKIGQWKGEAVNFVLHRRYSSWGIGIWTMDMTGCLASSLYINLNNSSSTPENGWRVCREGVGPAPRCLESNDSNVSSLDNEVLVEGCGIPEVNGAYARIVGRLNWGVPMYRKRGQWEGETVDFVIYSTNVAWFISTWSINMEISPMSGGYPSIDFYYRLNDCGVVFATPPKNGWMVDGSNGVRPAPTCRLN